MMSRLASNVRYLMVLVFLFGCKSNSEEVNSRKGLPSFLSIDNPVHIQKLWKSSFRKQLISNGKLKAVRRSDLQFKMSETIISINVHNGMYVTEGQVLATLYHEEQDIKLEQSKIELAKAQIELQDFQLRYSRLQMDDSTQRLIANLHSGTADARLTVRQAQNDLEATLLKAPFSGKIANVNYRLYERYEIGNPFCSLIDDSKFELNFFVLETELSEIRVGQGIVLRPLLDSSSHTGKVSQINPQVNENGLVLVKALVNNSGNLVEGMNAQILIESEVPNQLVVPKSAVVQRQNQEVLFKYENGKASWVYVLVLYENTEELAVTAHPDKSGSLMAGDTVIIAGNLNLAHGSNVTIDAN